MTEAELLARVEDLEREVERLQKVIRRAQESVGDKSRGHLGLTLRVADKLVLGDTGAVLYYNGKSSRNAVHLVVVAPKDFLVHRESRIQNKKHGS